MKVRESGMPNEDMWKGFFRPKAILKKLGLNGARDVVDFGCGYGTFSIPAAKMVKGRVYAIDIEQDMINETRKKADNSHLKNVETRLRDFSSSGTGLEDKSVDYVMLFNILHAKEPVKLLREAYRILREGGRVGIMHWNYDPSTPRGPPMEIRPKPEQCVKWALSAGFVNPRMQDLNPYHYGIVLMKQRGKNER